MIIDVAGEEIELLPEKAFFWKKEKLLGFSDVHLGKAESLQAYGVPIPSGLHYDDLQKISSLIEKTSPQKIVILGDLIHNRNSWTEVIQNDLQKFFDGYKEIEWVLIFGNHENGSKTQIENLKSIRIERDFKIGPFLMTHGHDKKLIHEDLFEIQGHVHPVVKIQEGSLRLRLPCFVVSSKHLTLPAFGTMTGGFEIRAKAGETVYAIAETHIFPIRPIKN